MKNRSKMMLTKKLFDEDFRQEAETIRGIVLEFIKLDSDILLLKDLLIDGVQEIDFTKPDAWDTLAELIATYSVSKGSSYGMVTRYCIDLIEGGKVLEYEEVTPKTHEDIEFNLEQPWKSSALRKLWKAITCYEFREMLEYGNELPEIINFLNIVLLITDEDAYVPYVEVVVATSPFKSEEDISDTDDI